MRKKNENRLTMYEGLLVLLDANRAKFTPVTGMPEILAEFEATVAAIKAKSTETDFTTVGKTEMKYNAEDALMKVLLPAMGGLYIYARRQGNVELQAKCDLPEYKLRQKRDTDLAQYAKQVSELAQANAEGVAAFNVSATMLTDLAAKVEAYTLAIGQRESSVVERKGARGSLNDLFSKAEEILDEEFDKLMENLRFSESELYNKYHAARVVKETGTRHRNGNGETVPAAPAGTNGGGSAPSVTPAPVV